MNIGLSINSYPKSGTHALIKVLKFLGFHTVPDHRPYTLGLHEGISHNLFIKRDPKNIVISNLRDRKIEVTPENFITLAEELLPDIDGYTGWLSDPKLLVISFEKLLEDNKEVERICNYLDVPLQDLYQQIPGDTATWTGKLSDYRDIWSEDLRHEWCIRGGCKLSEQWGYT